MGIEALPEAVAPRPAGTLDVVVVGGGGHVGLPLSLAFASAGLNVGIFDIAAERLEQIRRGEMPFKENGADELLAEILPTGRLTFSSSPELINKAAIVIVVVGTPIDEFLNPSMTVFERTVDQIAPHLQAGALVVLRSTVYPGTTESVTRALADHGCRVDVAFCPERIAEGQALEELGSLPQIVGADEGPAGDRAEALFSRLGAQTIRTTTKEAELSKLLTNAWRYLKFAVANQFFVIAHAAGIDYESVLHAIKTDYPRARDLPAPGLAAGPCLLKDTMQLAAFTADHFALGQAAMQANEGLPAYMVGAIEQKYGSLVGKTIGILGMAFKPESDDVRSALSYKLRKLLKWSGARVLCTDPFVADPRLVPLAEVLAGADILVVGVPHKAYLDLDLKDRIVVDVWGALGQGIRI
jgi:UDP-N-acetyl-D-mannosaminuronic acid dehydrogenase